MHVVGVVHEESLVAPFETMLRLGSVPRFEVTNDVSRLGELFALGDVDVLVTGRHTAAAVMEMVEGLDQPVRDRTKFVLMTSSQNKNVVKLAASLGFDGIIDVYQEPLTVHQHLRNIILMSGDWAHSVTADASPDLLFLATRDASDRAIIAHVALGMTDKQISSETGLAPQTVRNRLSKIMSESGLTNRTQLAHMWLREQSLLMRQSKDASTAGQTL